MPLSELESARAVAGRRYAAALSEFRAAFVDLAALDVAIGNRHVGGDVAPTFAEIPTDFRALMHPTYAPEKSQRRVTDEVRDASDAYVAASM